MVPKLGKTNVMGAKIAMTKWGTPKTAEGNQKQRK